MSVGPSPFGLAEGYEYEYPSSQATIQPSRAPQFETEAFFPMTGDGRYSITVRVMKADASCMVPLECMDDIEMASDSGADMILITREESDRLGYQVDMLSEDYNFVVQGISNEPTVFKEITTWVQLGNMRPLQCPIGLAVDTDALVQTLFGNKGTVDSGQIEATYSSEGVLYRETMSGSASQVSVI
jgi:hypothetical protein